MIDSIELLLRLRPFSKFNFFRKMSRRPPSSQRKAHSSQLILPEENDGNNFQKGSIKCIKLRDFMTFEKMTISPSSGLNLIIGPNGSGKSSIVCAIALGLAATPSVLARTSKISGFIRHGCNEAKIKILLVSSPNFWICRKIKSDNSSSWQYRTEDGPWKNITQGDIIEKVQNLHIQLDNLCMFLPQERVKEFSSLKPRDLLTATEQAINREVYESHQHLLKSIQEQKQLYLQISDLQTRFDKYQTQIDQMKGDAIRFRQVEECKENIEKHEKTILWVQYQTEYRNCKELKTQYREAKQTYEAISE